MSSDRLHAPSGIQELVNEAFERGRRIGRHEAADIAATYPLSGFAYDENSHSDLLRLKLTIAEALDKGMPAGVRIR